jgi:hypothetical protein
MPALARKGFYRRQPITSSQAQPDLSRLHTARYQTGLAANRGTLNNGMSLQHHTVKESYRNQDYVAVIRFDHSTNLWTWKSTIEFDAGPHTLSTNRTFITAAQAEDHMRQAVHQCIENRLG